MNYQEFIESKKHSSINYGIDVNFEVDSMFPYQKKVLEYSVNKGRAAVFLDTGLGKTLIELCVAQNYIQHTNKPVLIITPLAVAFQFIKEAEKFGIGDIECFRIAERLYARLDGLNFFVLHWLLVFKLRIF